MKVFFTVQEGHYAVQQNNIQDVLNVFLVSVRLLETVPVMNSTLKSNYQTSQLHHSLHYYSINEAFFQQYSMTYKFSPLVVELDVVSESSRFVKNYLMLWFFQM